MIGGKTSFAAGGWFGSPVEPLLPVSMELKQEHRKLAVAMAIVMDRSGSMAMTVPGTTLQKMDLANEGAARGIELLGDNDLVTLIRGGQRGASRCPRSSRWGRIAAHCRMRPAAWRAWAAASMFIRLEGRHGRT